MTLRRSSPFSDWGVLTLSSLGAPKKKKEKKISVRPQMSGQVVYGMLGRTVSIHISIELGGQTMCVNKLNGSLVTKHVHIPTTCVADKEAFNP